ncbi:MarR family transcriptional regulator [Pseudonocardia sp.]|uniref:MarR family winged helix-turn-helix transcriptional regulator n=1 Tax=Pseudonocardia sp. TaxID=60912 RepID=UPI0025D3A1E5|nr:MarR family transcriptional regulator [Pseudonocardia sp.]
MSEPTPAPVPVPGGELVDAVMTASRVLVAVAARSLAAAGDVTLPQYRALVVLATRGPQRGIDLAEALGVNPSSATRLLDRLSRGGLIRRTRLRADRRAVRVALSPTGRQLVAEVTQRRRQEVEQLMRALPAEQHQLVVTALHAIADAAGEAPERDLAVGLGW